MVIFFVMVFSFALSETIYMNITIIPLIYTMIRMIPSQKFIVLLINKNDKIKHLLITTIRTDIGVLFTTTFVHIISNK